MIRIDPTTGAGSAGNPLAASSDVNARRIVAYGLRNPFRMAFRPGTSDLFVGRCRLGHLGGDRQAHRSGAAPHR